MQYVQHIITFKACNRLNDFYKMLSEYGAHLVTNASNHTTSNSCLPSNMVGGISDHFLYNVAERRSMYIVQYIVYVPEAHLIAVDF
jgi:hypothetical protein